MAGCAGRWSHSLKEKRRRNAGQSPERHVPLPGSGTERSKTKRTLLGPESDEKGWGDAGGSRRDERVSMWVSDLGSTACLFEGIPLSIIHVFYVVFEVTVDDELPKKHTESRNMLFLSSRLTCCIMSQYRSGFRHVVRLLVSVFCFHGSVRDGRSNSLRTSAIYTRPLQAFAQGISAPGYRRPESRGAAPCRCGITQQRYRERHSSGGGGRLSAGDEGCRRLRS